MFALKKKNWCRRVSLINRILYLFEFPSDKAKKMFLLVVLVFLHTYHIAQEQVITLGDTHSVGSDLHE